MLCKYQYKSGDELVVSGKKQIGEICNLQYGSERYGGYCPAHARQMGTMPAEDMEYERKRRSETKAEQKERKDKATQAALNDESLNKNVLTALNLNQPCDLRVEYAELKALNQRRTFINYDEKFAFARWLQTPQHLRKPQAVEDAAVILGVSPNTLNNWRTSPDIIKIINADTENRALGLFPLAMYKLGVGVDRGDVQSIKLYKEWYEEKMAVMNKTAKSIDLPPEMQKEANDYGRATQANTNGVALEAEKNMVIATHYAAPDVE
jgi:hypothetical protein